MNEQEMMNVDAIRLTKRHRIDLGDIPALAKSIGELGLLHPLVVRPDGTLIAGGRRLSAVKHLGWREVPVRVLDLESIVKGEHAENVCRKDFTPSEAVAIGRALEPLERAAAAERMIVAHASPEKFTELDKGESLAKVAATVGMSRPTYEKARAVTEAAEAEPIRFRPLQEEMDRTGRVAGVYKKLQKQRQADAIRREPAPLPTGPFRVITADPPWQYDSRGDDQSHRAANPYPSMSAKQIMVLPVGKLAAPDSILWLWTTNAHLPLAFDVVAAWGFKYKTTLTWVKDRIGTGDWLRGQTEHCLLAVRGHPTILLTNQSTYLTGPMREHSRKPDEFVRLVEALCPGSKVELFAREQREGWTCWGNDVEHFAD